MVKYINNSLSQTENQLSINSKNEDGNIRLEGTVSKEGTTVKMSATGENGTMTIDATPDEDGNLKSGSFKNGDGSYLTRNEDGSIEFSDPKTGAYLKTDGDGNYVSLHVPMKNNSSYDYSDGTGVLVDNDNGYKVMWTHDENGNLVIAAPSGKYTVDENGNLFKDGQPVMVDGKQVNVETGFNRGEFSEAPIDFMEAICGTYLVSGSSQQSGFELCPQGKSSLRQPGCEADWTAVSEIRLFIRYIDRVASL